MANRPVNDFIHIRIKLLGTLPSRFRHPYAAAGLDLKVPDGLTVGELVERLEIPKERVAMIAINGYLAKADDRIPDRAIVKLIQPIAGG